MYTLLNCIYKTTILLQPFLPDSSKKIFKLLKQKEEVYFTEITYDIEEGIKLDKPEAVFPRFDKDNYDH